MVDSRGGSLGRLAEPVGARRRLVALSLYGLVTTVAFLGAWLLRFESEAGARNGSQSAPATVRAL